LQRLRVVLPFYCLAYSRGVKAKPFGVRQLAAAFEFRIFSSQFEILGQLGTQNWKLGILKSGSKLPHL
jgi:hypothetical protein